MSFKNAVVTFIVFSGILVLGFNNCSKSAEFNSNASFAEVNANSTAAENLLELLDDAKQTEARLREQGSPEAVAQANEIREYIDILENMISSSGQGLAVDDVRVLDFRDYLLNSHLMGRDMLIEYDFAQAIAELQAEDARLADLIANLQVQFETSLAALEDRLRAEIVAGDTTLQEQIDLLRNNFNAFQQIVDDRFVEVDGRLVQLETVVADLQQQVAAINDQITNINLQIENLQNSVNENQQSLTVLVNVQQTLVDFKNQVQIQIVNITQQGVDLSQQLADHQNAYTDLIDQQNTLATVKGKMCQMTADGSLASGQTACAAASSEEDVIAGTCCLTVDTLDCDMLFDGDSAEAELVNNQCNAFVVTVTNRDNQVKELAEIQKEQDAMMQELLTSVQNIQIDIADVKNTVSQLWVKVDGLQSDITTIQNHLSNLDDRVLLLEFKAARSEAVAGLNEMSDLYLAWLARRQLDVRSRFCSANSKSAYDRSDYESAKHNWVYCQERLTWISEATEMIQLAKAYTNGLASVNMDQACTAPIQGTPADDVTTAQMASNPEIPRSVIESCQSGVGLVKAMLTSVVKLHNKIGPDFRTADYMAKKAKIVQLLYFGGEVATVGSAAIEAFENVDPSSAAIADTYYGRIERPFINLYVETRLRVRGAYPEDPSQMSPSIAGFNRAYTHAEIDEASTDYLARVKNLELKGSCAGCDFVVTGRNVVKSGSERYSYPIDAKTQCPIYNDHVMIRADDGQHYAYRVNYTRAYGATETLKPYWRWGSTHYPIAASDADVENGKFRRCGYRVNHLVHRFGMPDTRLRGRLAMFSSAPYAKSHGLPQCRRARFTCRLWEGTDGNGEWTAPTPTSNVMHYLNGFAESKIQPFCDQSGVDYTVQERDLSTDEKSVVRYYKAQQTPAGATAAARMSSPATQLTSDYWMIKDQAIPYGSGNNAVSQTKPFFGSTSSYGSPFFRTFHRLTDFESIKVQQCFDGNP